MATSEQTDDQSSASQVRIQLTSRDTELQIPQETGPILVSTGFRRYALSTLVNTLLEHEKPVPLEFLINGQFLRSTLDDYLSANGLSAETTLTVEYVRALIPPVYSTSFQHDDWVSSVDVVSSTSQTGLDIVQSPSQLGQERVVSGSYDGLIRIWNTTGQLLATSCTASDGGHSSSIKAVRFLSSTKVVSAAADRTIRIWDHEIANTDGDQGLTAKLALFGHRSSIDAIAVHAPSARILSASADHSVGLWSTRKSDAPQAPENLLPSYTGPNKRRRMSKPARTVPQRGPLQLLSGHTNPVSGVIFAPNDTTVAHSSSWDHTMRTWDLPTGSLVDTRTTSHPLLSVCALSQVNLIVTGSTARHITAIDPRASAVTVAAITLRGHVNAVSSLAADPNSAYGLVSASHDGTCRIWDIRSVKPGTGRIAESGGLVGESVYIIPRNGQAEEEKRRVAGEGVKVFGVAWDQQVGIVSAGEDRRVQINASRP